MRLYPQSHPRETHSHAERALYSALSAVSLPWTAFHSLRLRTRDGWEGEGDFVIADPTAGLLVLEVKGGSIELRGGHWFQNGHALHQPPRAQAQGFAKRLIEELRRAGCETPPFGVACVFPDCDFSAGPTTGDLRDLVLGRRDLAHLEVALPSVFSHAVPSSFRVPQNRRWIEQLKTLWGDSWVPTVTLTDRVEDLDARAVALDANQYRLLEYAGETPRELVAAACAEAVARGVAASCSPLTSVLMSEFAPGVRSCPEGAAGLVVTESRSALEALEAGATAAAVVSTFLFEEGADAGRLLAMRRLGFAEMVRRLGLALSTAHGRYERAVRSLSSIARRLGADEDTLTQAITDLSAV
jgi:hypothetical protein